MKKHDMSPGQPSDRDIAAQVITVLKLSIAAVGPRQNQIRNMLGDDPQWYQRDIALLSPQDKGKLLQLISDILTTEERLRTEKSQVTGLAKPRVWRISDEILAIEKKTMRIELAPRRLEASPLDLALGAAPQTTVTHLVIEGTSVGIWNSKAGIQPQDISSGAQITMRSGRVICLLDTAAPILDPESRSAILLGGFEKGDASLNYTKADIKKTATDDVQTILLPTLSRERQLEGHDRQIIVTNNSWSGTVVLPKPPVNTISNIHKLNDLFEGFPTERQMALHEVGLFRSRYERGLSDGHNFIPLTRPTNFDGDNRLIKALSAVSAERWPDLIRAIKYCFPRTILPTGFDNASKAEVAKIINPDQEAEPTIREEVNTGCFHGYSTIKVEVPEGGRRGYLVFELNRPNAEPVFVVDTAEVGAGYIFITKDDAISLATEAISIQEAQKRAHARIIHKGNEVEWMAKFDAELDKLGVVKNFG